MRRPDFSRRVAVTGLGIVSPVGKDIPTAWTNLVAGNTGLQRITRWDPRSRVPRRGRGQRLRGHRVDGLQGRPPDRQERRVRRRRRQAGARRLRARGRRPRTREDIGVIFGSGVGGPGPHGAGHRDAEDEGPEVGQPVLHRQHAARHRVRPDRHRARASRARTCASSRPARRAPTTSARRPRASAAATSWRRSAGSTETPLYEVGYIGFSNMRGMGTPREGRAARRRSRGRSTGRATASCSARAPARWCSRTSSYAKARGATIYAEVVGYGSAADAWDLIQPVEKGDGTRRAMEMALERHGVPARRGRPHQPARHLDAAGRPARGAGHPGGLRRPHAATSPSAAPSR